MNSRLSSSQVELKGPNLSSNHDPIEPHSHLAQPNKVKLALGEQAQMGYTKGAY